jgi:hypothetical protein
MSIVKTGSPSERWQLAGREDLSLEVYEALARDQDVSVIEALVFNYATPTSVLSKLATTHPDLVHDIRLNPNAPSEMKETAPIGSHIPTSIERYLNDQRATVAQRQQLQEVYDASPHPGGSPLGEVWRQVRS